MPRPKNYKEKVEDYKTTEKRKKDKAPNSKEKRRKAYSYRAKVEQYEQEKLPEEGRPYDKAVNRYKKKTRGETKWGKYLTEEDEPGPGAEIGTWVDKQFFEPYVDRPKIMKAVVEHYSDPEIPIFTQYKKVLPSMEPTEFGLSPNSKKWEHWLKTDKFSHYLTTEQKREIERRIWENRWHGYKHYALDLMNKLYEEGMDGNINAAKEFLNRVLGSPAQQISLTHEAGDSLQDLFKKFTAVQAYQRPEIDNDGNEVIELDWDDGAGRYYDQGNGEEQKGLPESQEEDKS